MDPYGRINQNLKSLIETLQTETIFHSNKSIFLYLLTY